MSPREAIAPTVAMVRHRAAHARAHRPAGVAVASAQAAAITPRTEQTRTAARLTVTNLDSAKDQAKPVERDDFKSKLKAAIRATTPQPKTESEADKVMKTGAKQARETVRGHLTSERDAAAGPLKSQSAPGADVPASEQEAPAQMPLQPEQIGLPPAPVSAASVVPAPLPADRLDYSSDRESTDRAMAENNVSKEQLEKGNEPAFGQTLEARAAAEQHEASAVTSYRQSEATGQDQARQAAQAELAKGLGAMHGSRLLHVSAVVGKQVGTTAKNALERQRITETIVGIKNRTRSDVAAILTSMETEAANIFEAGLKRAEKAYEDTFKEEKGGAWTWITTWGSDWEELIESSLGKARDKYLAEVDIAVDRVADLIDGKLAAAKRRVAEGLMQVSTFVAGLKGSVKHFGEEALKAVSTDFEAMSAEIDQRRDALVDKLAQQYKASYERMSAMEERLREENKSLWQRVYDATIGLIKKILAFKDMLLGILARAAEVVGAIIQDPIGFLGNLVGGVKAGLDAFLGNIAEHLKQGLFGWLFGALQQAGIQLPERFDLKGIFNLIFQVLGLVYSAIRARAVRLLGEDLVARLEQAAEIFKVLMTEGPAGLWEMLKERIVQLKDTVIEEIKSWVITRVIRAGITWIIGLLNPAGAFFKACKAIYDIVMFFIERGRQIVELVDAVIGAVGAIVGGNIQAMAGAVEGALVRALPVAISFLASLLGLGGISESIRNIIQTIRQPIERAIDWVIGKAVQLARRVGQLFTGRRDRGVEREDEDPEKQAKIEAGKAAIDQEEKQYIRDGQISRENSVKVAEAVAYKHPVFKSLTVIEGHDRWNYSYTASPSEIYQGEPKEEDKGEVDTESIFEAALTAISARPAAETRLDETSANHGKEQLIGVFSANNVPASAAQNALDVIEKLLKRALEETSAREIEKRMRSVSGIANETLRNAGSSTQVVVHHIQRVEQHPGTFTESRRERLYIPKKYKDSIDQWVKKHAHLSPKEIESRKTEIIGILRDQLMQDKHLNLEAPLKEIEMVVTTARSHQAAHRVMAEFEEEET